MSVLSDFSRPISITFSSITAMTISWTQPPFSLPMDEYRVDLRRVTGGRQLCTMFEDNKSKMTTGISTVEFTNLHEFSIYNVTITVTLPSGFTATLTPTVEFTTKAAGIHAYYVYSYVVTNRACLLFFSTYCSSMQHKYSLYHLQKCQNVLDKNQMH